MTTEGSIDVRFIDTGIRSTQKADSRYPDGKALILLLVGCDVQKTCTRNLPYPAPRCGSYEVECAVCGFRALFPVTGRPDDPNMITMPCKGNGRSN
jgi:hypothetical protein